MPVWAFFSLFPWFWMRQRFGHHMSRKWSSDTCLKWSSLSYSTTAARSESQRFTALYDSRISEFNLSDSGFIKVSAWPRRQLSSLRCKQDFKFPPENPVCWRAHYNSMLWSLQVAGYDVFRSCAEELIRNWWPSLFNALAFTTLPRCECLLNVASTGNCLREDHE